MNLAPAPHTSASRVLIAALAALAALFALWFGRAPNPWVALAVFALPPALLAIGRWRGRRTAGYWSSVFALFWFSHGIMVAYSRPIDRWFGLAEVALALVIIFASSGPGMRARLAQKKAEKAEKANPPS
jgi:uncharacterized membrane protein